MRMRSLYSIACGLLTMTAASLPANADVKWSGPGYYLTEEDSAAGLGDAFLVSGPYASQADCTSALNALPQKDQDNTYLDPGCDYEATDPGGN